MALKVASFIVLAVPYVICGLVETRRDTGRGRLRNTLNCVNKPPYGGDTEKRNCLDACQKFKAGETVFDYSSRDNNGCYVTIVQSTKNTYEAGIARDACTRLVNACPNGNATSEFVGDGGANMDAGGTLRVTYNENPLPSGGAYSVASWVNNYSGDYEVKEEDCAAAVQNAIPQGSINWQHAKGPLNSAIGTCRAEWFNTAYSSLDPARGSSGGQDVLAVPNVCNTQGLCRTSINATIGVQNDPYTYVVFSQN